MKTPVYLDYNASAPLRAEALAVMQDALARAGIASAVHSFGRGQRAAIERAREQVGALAGVNAAQVVFTSGATEANNAVLQAFRGQRILVSAIEHASVLNVVPEAELIPVTKDGVADEAAFAALLDKGPAPALVSVMLANNQTGAIQPVEKLARLARQKYPSVHVHTDAVSAAGKIAINFPALQVDYMTLSGHKIAGPQGIGALIISPGAKPVKLIHGAGQESGQRAGTENTSGIAGFGAAAALAFDAQKNEKLTQWRDKMEAALRRAVPEAIVLAQNAPRLANTSFFGVPGLAAQTILMALDIEGFAVSAGAACSSGTNRPSLIGQAMGLPEGFTALRVSTGWNTRESDIDAFTEAWIKIAGRMGPPQAKERQHA